MPYLIKALGACRAPISFDKDVDWAAGEIREVEDELYARYANNTAAFTVLAGPGNAEVLSAALAALSGNGAEGGETAAPTVSAKEQGSGLLFQTVLTLSATPVELRRGQGQQPGGGGLKIFEFPAGRVLLLGAVAALAVKPKGAAPHVAGQISIGTGSGQQDIVQGTAFQSSNGAAVRGVGVLSVADAAPVAAFLNITGIGADAAVTVSGTVTLTWVRLGD
jgi:hypothetical protein